ncbi:hypothetical protein AK830_g2947 [Neonectria ditissima]|uniref:Pentatricopeptide repeat-containing protein-mitochondrial domain-containing protein n=1 Tax=Neonectria ditissima TaxID=78410 RepID=A0A0P7BQD3_9HYPO|nr:hypothetical protein AK830_g2947 [Neonectria ditissima]
MLRVPLLYDGLWRCLCPAFDENVLPRALNGSFLARPTRPSLRSNRPVPNAGLIQRRRHGTDTEFSTDGPPSFQSIDSFFATVSKKKSAIPANDDPYRLLEHKKPTLEAGEVPSEAVIKALEIIRDRHHAVLPDTYARIVLLVKYLLVTQAYPLDAWIYECLMDAMKDPQGSASGVQHLLRDMKSHGIIPTARICYSALEALTVHPDYIMRQEVIDAMSNYWYEMTKSARQNIAIGLLRDGQHELALAQLTDLFEEKARIDLWVYDIFIVEFGRVGFLDEMLQLLRQRKFAKGTDDPFRSLLLHALDLFSQAYHEVGTKFVWDFVVSQKILNPSNVIIENVLGTAARHADTKLATEALDILSNRGRVPDYQHEALVDAFAAAEDMAGALGALAIMERNGAIIQRSATRTIYKALKKNPFLITEATAAIEQMAKTGMLPLEAIAVAIEATAQVRGSDAAMPLYNDTFSLTGKSPGPDTLKELILNSTNVETTWALSKDYLLLVPRGTHVEEEVMELYDRMIPACAQAGDFDRAFEYAERAMEAERALEIKKIREAKRITAEMVLEAERALQVEKALETENALEAEEATNDDAEDDLDLNVVSALLAGRTAPGRVITQGAIAKAERAARSEAVRAERAAQAAHLAESKAEKGVDAELEEGGDKTWLLRPWVEPLVDYAVAAKDGRVWPIVDEMAKGGESEVGSLQTILQRHRMVRRSEELKAKKQDASL